jgi:hypothetical protein
MSQDSLADVQRRRSIITSKPPTVSPARERNDRCHHTSRPPVPRQIWPGLTRIRSRQHIVNLTTGQPMAGCHGPRADAGAELATATHWRYRNRHASGGATGSSPAARPASEPPMHYKPLGHFEPAGIGGQAFRRICSKTLRQRNTDVSIQNVGNGQSPRHRRHEQGLRR